MEEWKQVIIDGEEWNYEVSNYGNVRNKKTGRILKLHETHKGYLEIGLYKNNKAKIYKVHRLVAIMFIPNDNTEKTQINHINEIKTDNRVENLEWCTSKENANHGTRTERVSKSNMKKIKCLETGQEFESIKEASIVLGLDTSGIAKCCKGYQEVCGNLHFVYLS